jgi:hypothetical protein
MFAIPHPDPPPQARGPAIVVPACTIPVSQPSYVEVWLGDQLVCASQERPKHHHPRRPRHRRHR